MTSPRADDIALLEQAIEESGLSQRQYAMQVLVRDERTVRKWLAGDRPIPYVVLTYLARTAAEPLAASLTPSDDEEPLD